MALFDKLVTMTIDCYTQSVGSGVGDVTSIVGDTGWRWVLSMRMPRKLRLVKRLVSGRQVPQWCR